MNELISGEIVALMRRLTRAYGRALRGFELKPVEAHILAELFAAGALKVGDLGVRLGLRGSTLTGTLDRLERRELIRRESDPADRRALRVVPPAWDSRRRARFADVFRSVENDFFAALTKRERAQLVSLLSKVNSSHEERVRKR